MAAIGYPFGEKQSLSVGVVSAIDRAIDSLTEFQISGAIQTDAAINPGNSGGPLVDGRGRVIGVNQQIKTRSGGGEGVGFAVPADVVARSLDGLRADGKAATPTSACSRCRCTRSSSSASTCRSSRARGCRASRATARAKRRGSRGGNGDVRFQVRAFAEGGDIVTRIEDRPIHDADDLSGGPAVRPGPEGDRRGLARRREAQGRAHARRAAAVGGPVGRVSGVAFDLAHALREIVLPRSAPPTGARTRARAWAAT